MMESSQETENETAEVENEKLPATDNTVETLQDREFTKELRHITEQAEQMRIRYMGKLRVRQILMFWLILICVMGGGAAFGWFFLVKNNLNTALFLMLCAFAPPVILQLWVNTPRKTYRKAYKAKVLPEIAKALGNLKFHPQKGVGAKFLQKSGILPKFDKYDAEDCFAGKYKNTKIVLSEARIFDSNVKDAPVFDGVLILLELNGHAFKGHTIVTNDTELHKKLTSWQKHPVEQDTLFRIFTNTPQENHPATHPKLLEELQETSDLFENAPVTAAFFGGRFMFIAIPCAQDLFEPSTVFVPITTHQDALRCKQEIHKILSIIDLLDIYGT